MVLRADGPAMVCGAVGEGKAGTHLLPGRIVTAAAQRGKAGNARARRPACAAAAIGAGDARFGDQQPDPAQREEDDEQDRESDPTGVGNRRAVVGLVRAAAVAAFDEARAGARPGAVRVVVVRAEAAGGAEEGAAVGAGLDAVLARHVHAALQTVFAARRRRGGPGRRFVQHLHDFQVRDPGRRLPGAGRRRRRHGRVLDGQDGFVEGRRRGRGGAGALEALLAIGAMELLAGEAGRRLQRFLAARAGVADHRLRLRKHGAVGAVGGRRRRRPGPAPLQHRRGRRRGHGEQVEAGRAAGLAVLHLLERQAAGLSAQGAAGGSGHRQAPPRARASAIP